MGNSDLARLVLQTKSNSVQIHVKSRPVRRLRRLSGYKIHSTEAKKQMYPCMHF